jgi:hypothetical protein
MAIEVEEMRSCVIEALRRTPRTQYVNLEIETAVVARERGLPMQQNHECHLQRQDLRRFREMVWALVIEGVMTIGMDDANPQWPFLSLTEYGEQVVLDRETTPYDPSGYLRAMINDAPFDDIENRYLSQALVAFRHNLADASAVMLGAASEHLITLLGERVAATDSVVAPTLGKRLEGPALRLLSYLHDYLRPKAGQLPRDLKESLDTTFLGIANLIRIARNDAGHPFLAHVSRDQAFVALQLFPTYRRWVRRVMSHLPLGDHP